MKKTIKPLKLSSKAIYKAAEVIKNGGIVCFPTDTIYGLLALASDKEAIERLYTIRRPSGRPFILLLPHAGWVKELGLLAKDKHLRLMSFLNVTFIFYKRDNLPLYLTRGRKSLAVRVPSTPSMRELLEIVGEPVVAPSANPEGEKPATTIKEAIEYFGENVDLYIDGGTIIGKPSTIVRVIYPHGFRLVREGHIPFDTLLKLYKSLETTSSSVPLPEGAPLMSSLLDLFGFRPPFLPPR